MYKFYYNIGIDLHRTCSNGDTSLYSFVSLINIRHLSIKQTIILFNNVSTIILNGAGKTSICQISRRPNSQINTQNSNLSQHIENPSAREIIVDNNHDRGQYGQLSTTIKVISQSREHMVFRFKNKVRCPITSFF